MLQFSFCRNIKLVKLQTWFCSLRTPIKSQLIILPLAEKSGSWWWTGKPGVLQSMGSQSWTGLSDWIELNWKLLWICHLFMHWGLAGDLGKFMLRILDPHCLDSSFTECSSLHFAVASVVSWFVRSSSGQKHGQFCLFSYPTLWLWPVLRLKGSKSETYPIPVPSSKFHFSSETCLPLFVLTFR